MGDGLFDFGDGGEGGGGKRGGEDAHIYVLREIYRGCGGCWKIKVINEVVETDR